MDETGQPIRPIVPEYTQVKTRIPMQTTGPDGIRVPFWPEEVIKAPAVAIVWVPLEQGGTQPWQTN